jgi:hypothetical protein
VVEVDVVVVLEVVIVVVGTVPGGSFGPLIRGEPMYSKCIPSGNAHVPPHANPCRRNTSTIRSSIVGVAPYAFEDGLMSMAAPQLCRERFRPVVPVADRMRRVFQQPPARRVSGRSMSGARPACSNSASDSVIGPISAR